MIIHNAIVVTFDEQNRVLRDGAVRFENATIDELATVATC